MLSFGASNAEKRTLEKELLEQGFNSFGPYAFSEIPEALGYLLKKESDSLKQAELRIIKGSLARADMGGYPSLYMIYAKFYNTPTFDVLLD